jgi:hypothetical protein
MTGDQPGQVVYRQIKNLLMAPLEDHPLAKPFSAA